VDTGKVIALTGIIATAVVGVAGAASSWLIARQDRGSQRAIAHDERVYDRKADAYIDAARLLGSVSIAWTKLPLLHGSKTRQGDRAVARTALKLDRRLQEGENLLQARLVAYGSDAGYQAWRNALAWLAEGIADTERSGEFPLPEDIKAAQNAINKFAVVVHRELD
jgi:hypothetical protein